MRGMCKEWMLPSLYAATSTANSTTSSNSSKWAATPPTKTTSSSATSSTAATTPSKPSSSSSPSKSATPTASRSSGAITNPAKSPRSTDFTTSASANTAASTSGGTAPRYSITSPSRPSSRTRYSQCTGGSAPASTPWIKYGSSIASRKCPTTGPCAISCGRIPRKSTDGGFPPAEPAICSGGMSSPCSMSGTIWISLPGRISWSWRGTGVCFTIRWSRSGVPRIIVIGAGTSRRFWSWMRIWRGVSRFLMRRRMRRGACRSRILRRTTFCREWEGAWRGKKRMCGCGGLIHVSNKRFVGKKSRVWSQFDWKN
mmetsp:Transcript_28678/g.60296  ORF Transcript_28678/g.60296 Transcript_28678/m.60296 type:complete len:313 (-) Transcript_28678:779-1717(-)